MSCPKELPAEHAFLMDFCRQNSLKSGLTPKEKISPENLIKIITKIIILKRKDNHWSFSLIGTSIVDEYQKDFTGLRVEEIPHAQCQTIYNKLIDKVSEDFSPWTISGRFCYEQKDYLSVRDTAFPLTVNGRELSHIVIISTIDREQGGNVERRLYHPTLPTDFEWEALKMS